MIANVSLAASDSRRATIVPKDALITRGSQRFVYVVESDQAVKMLPVTTGIGVGNWVEVKGPVTPGTKVVTRGNERIRPGQQVIAEPIEYPAP
jgi:multidrug efflux pump subunit AcrA (membrane-fusion protein)